MFLIVIDIFVDLENGVVLQLRLNRGLALEPPPPVIEPILSDVEILQRDPATEFLVERFPDDAHAALANLVLALVAVVRGSHGWRAGRIPDWNAVQYSSTARWTGYCQFR